MYYYKNNNNKNHCSFACREIIMIKNERARKLFNKLVHTYFNYVNYDAFA